MRIGVEQKKRIRLVQTRPNFAATTASVLTVTWCATKWPTVLTNRMSLLIVMWTSALKWKFTNVDTNVLIPLPVTTANATKVTSK